MKTGSDYTENNGLIIGDDGLARPAWAASSEILREYYDTEWGMPVRDEQGLFERLSLEAFQAGLSWETILKKRPAFREDFANFNPDVVADFDHNDVERLMNDERIIRNRRKINAVINNAEATIALREQGGLAELMWSYKPDKTPEPHSIEEVPNTSEESKALAKALKKAGFKFVGPTTVFASMAAVGIVDINIVGAHRRGASGVFE
ncbi:MAG: DNA-3-methyladenine glycosylase I [Corynebacterium sp.]|uniref:DNA-3-methyladenine glycosylase I n=1 Tax=Corynebacterium sp. TaxID=1720 RepID=UPI0026DDA7E2|nr:DNA-3-methyladenine glycosylase I [Corynebacterium sp.]MDO5029700.1 DNA-3-methyladenine glycosylase I [Corynebacterium sp.]